MSAVYEDVKDSVEVDDAAVLLLDRRLKTELRLLA